MKSLLLISRQSPYGGSYAHEALDIALSAAAFDISVSLLFMDDGVYQLLKGQQPMHNHTKKLESVLSALPLYDINDLWVERESMTARGVASDALSQPAKPIASAEIAALVSSFDRMLTI